MFNLSQLKSKTRNPRKISKEKMEQLKRSVSEFPKMLPLRPMVYDPVTMEVLGGNQRLEALRQLGYKEIPDEWIRSSDGLTEEEKKRFVIADNAGFGEWDWEILAEDWNADELAEWGVDLPEFEGVPVEAVEDGYEVPEGGIETDIVIGDVFQIGVHRLMCGDSTDSDMVAKLMDGEKVDMVFTSPPYNSGGNSSTGGYGGNKEREKKKFYTDAKASDNWTKEGYFSFCMSIFNCISIISGNETPILWNVMYNANSRDDYGKIVFSDLNPFTVKETIIWDKGVGMNIAGNGILSRTCELIFLMSKGEKYFTNQNGGTYWNTWRISNQDGENMQWGHGASFPVRLPIEGIEKFSMPGANIYEPFCGSGTTMVAAHQLNRKCYGMELDPKYCQVIIDRMRKFDPDIKITRNGVEI